MEIFVLSLVAIGSLIWAAKGSSAIGRLEEKHQQLRKELARAASRVETLASELKTLRDTVSNLKTAPPASPAEPPPPAPEPIAQMETLVGAPPLAAPTLHVEEQPEEPSTPAEPLAGLVIAPLLSEPPAPPPEPPEPPPPPPPPPPVRSIPPKPRFDWEALVGVKLFSWVAGIALVFAAIFFLKYSVDHGWLGPPIRMAIGLVTGTALLVVCEWKAARRYAITANALDAAGVAILFSTFFAAHALWNLVGAVPTFGLMAMVTAVAVLLSIHHDSMFLALLGLVGGFATPALLSTGEDRPISLFSYLVLLDVGLAWVAYRKRWPYLTALSTLFTTIYQWGWVMKFLREGNIPLALGIFLVFPILSFAGTGFGEKRDSSDETSLLFRKTSAISVALPLLFAVYMAAVPAYGDRYWLLFGFLFLVDAGLAAIAAKRGPELLHSVAGISTVV